LGLYAKSESMRTPVDLETLCPRNAPPSAVVVVLLDMSDRMSMPQKLEVRNALDRIVRDEIPKHGLVEVYAVGRIGEPVIKPAFHLCNPGSGMDLSPFYQNPELARSRWEEKFKQRLDAELLRQFGEPDSRHSPIFEAIQATALRTFGNPRHDGVAKRLVIVSDLLQHVPGKASHYGSIPEFTKFKNDPYFNEVRTDLRGIAVTALYLLRLNARETQGRQHITFWEQYFAAQGGSMEAVTSIYGAQ
jgi:hypothetical protein